MIKIATGFAFVGLIFAMVAGASIPASAEDSSCANRQLPRTRVVGCSETAPFTREFAAQKKRPRVTIYPRHVRPGPYAKRQCYSWLVTEYRVSGPVIAPQMRCWWE